VQDEPSQLADTEQPERLDLKWLAVGKRSGLSFEEMNELRLIDLQKYVDAYADTYKDKKESKARMATQEDIDRFFS
jgi:hypothetical protein